MTNNKHFNGEMAPEEETKILRQPSCLEKVILEDCLSDMIATEGNDFSKAQQRAQEVLQNYENAGVMVLSYFERYNKIYKDKGYLTQEEADVLIKSLA